MVLQFSLDVFFSVGMQPQESKAHALPGLAQRHRGLADRRGPEQKEEGRRRNHFHSAESGRKGAGERRGFQEKNVASSRVDKTTAADSD